MAFTTKKSLLAKVRAGDEVSWTEFYAAYKPLILFCGQDCLLMPDGNDELVQQVSSAPVLRSASPSSTTNPRT